MTQYASVAIALLLACSGGSGPEVTPPSSPPASETSVSQDRPGTQAQSDPSSAAATHAENPEAASGDQAGYPAPPPAPRQPPPEQAPRDALIVPQHALESQRIAGKLAFVPPDTVKLAMKRQGTARLVSTTKMCVSTEGTVQFLKLLKSSGHKAYDAIIESQLRSWRYQPFLVDGKAVAVCTSVTLIYNQTVASP